MNEKSFTETPFLPSTPSELVALALKNLVLVENQPEEYVVDMGEWHKLLDNGKCAVCLAGATMAMSLRVPRDFDGRLEDLENTFPKNIIDKLYVLDDFRSGTVEDGLQTILPELTPIQVDALAMKIDNEFAQESIYAADTYKEDPGIFKRKLEIIIEVLKKEGF